MKKIQILLAAILISTMTFAQAPEKMSYQSVVRDAAGALIIGSPIGIQISILEGNATGIVVYSEEHTIVTNSNGLATLEIGTGVVSVGNFSLIDWSSSTYFLKTETDPTGGTSYTIVGTSQLISVPYALYAKTSGSSTPGPQGPQGAQGTAGSQGLQGVQGVAGANGVNGTNGVDGVDGVGGVTSAGTNVTISGSGTFGDPYIVNSSGANLSLVGTSVLTKWSGAGGTGTSEGTSSSLSNSYLGYRSGFNNTFGYDNTTNGYQALYSNTSGSNNTANGYRALYNNTTGMRNTANGTSALVNNITGFDNNASGFQAMYSNTVGSLNTAFGTKTLYFNTGGNNNTAVGNTALYSNTTGVRNTATGSSSLVSNVTGNDNNASGYNAMYSNTIGNWNTAAGSRALYSNTTGYDNTANGYSALYSNTTGHDNTVFGSEAMYFNTTGGNNTANGISALRDNTTGNNNTASGIEALQNNTTGSFNSAFGRNSLNANVTGTYNTAVGNRAFIYGTNYSNSTAIGSSVTITASNQVRIGATSVNSIGGQVGWTTLSDGRFKTDIQEDIPGLDFITQLRPVSYTVDVEKLNNFLGMNDSSDVKSPIEKTVQSGFIAQEVEATAKSLGYDFSGVDQPESEEDHYGLRYAAFTVPLVKSVQELNDVINAKDQELKELKLKIEALETKVNEIDEIKAVIESYGLSFSTSKN